MQTINELIASEIAASVEGYEGKFSVEVEIDELFQRHGRMGNYLRACVG